MEIEIKLVKVGDVTVMVWVRDDDGPMRVRWLVVVDDGVDLKST